MCVSFVCISHGRHALSRQYTEIYIADAVSYYRQYERWMGDAIENLRMVKTYRTPQTLRSFARLFTTLLPRKLSPVSQKGSIEVFITRLLYPLTSLFWMFFSLSSILCTDICSACDECGFSSNWDFLCGHYFHMLECTPRRYAYCIFVGIAIKTRTAVSL